MSDLVRHLECVRACLDDLAILTCDSWEDHANKTDPAPSRLAEAGLKANGLKSFFGQSEAECLEHVLAREGIEPQQKKVQGILNMAPPKNVKQLRSFTGAVDCCGDMWIRRSHVSEPLTKLLSKSVKWKWTDVEQQAFEQVKKTMSRETLSHCPDFNKPFETHTDASLCQSGAGITQDNKPTAFCSRKLNPAQRNCTTTERELLAIVETLKEFRTILLRQKTKVHTDHKNLTFANFNTERVLRWRMVLKEHSPESICTKGEHDLAADMPSRLDLLPEKEINIDEFLAFEHDEIHSDCCPVRHKRTTKEQNKDKKLLAKLKTDEHLSLKEFHGGGKSFETMTCKGKIAVPESLQQRTTRWHHKNLMHPGANCTEKRQDKITHGTD